jgi:hypothetical protein
MRSGLQLIGVKDSFAAKPLHVPGTLPDFTAIDWLVHDGYKWRQGWLNSEASKFNTPREKSTSSELFPVTIHSKPRPPILFVLLQTLVSLLLGLAIQPQPSLYFFVASGFRRHPSLT